MEPSAAISNMPALIQHSHVFLGAAHAQNERKTWAVIGLCGAMMLVEIVGGSLFGSLALVADGLHMSTHAGAILIAALAYRYARRHALDPRFVFGTGKLGELAGFTSAIILAMIALLIAYEGVLRFLAPVPIHFAQAIPIAVVGLLVNLVSARLLSDGPHGGHTHSHDHDHGHDHGATELEHNGDTHRHAEHSHAHAGGHTAEDPTHRDYNIRSAYVHVMADAVVSVLAITGLVLARTFGWLWMDPLVGMVGALVIGSWSYGLVRDTGRILLDMDPDQNMAAQVRAAIECDGDQLADLHLWRLGPGHLGAVLSVVTDAPRDCTYYRTRLEPFKSLSHVTVEVIHTAA
jgi:cation diffusion facilitator family transporter